MIKDITGEDIVIPLELQSPLLEEDWDKLNDVELEHTSEITFHTKHGKEVTFIKKPRWIPVSERLPDVFGKVFVTVSIPNNRSPLVTTIMAMYSDLMGITKPCFWLGEVGKDSFVNIMEYVTAWMSVPKPYEGSDGT